MNEYLYVVSEVQSVYTGLQVLPLLTPCPAVNFPYIKPYNQYVLLAPCTVVRCLLQTLIYFSSFVFLTYILFCIVILRFPSFIELVQIVAC